MYPCRKELEPSALFCPALQCENLLFFSLPSSVGVTLPVGQTVGNTFCTLKLNPLLRLLLIFFHPHPNNNEQVWISHYFFFINVNINTSEKVVGRSVGSDYRRWTLLHHVSYSFPLGLLHCPTDERTDNKETTFSPQCNCLKTVSSNSEW